MGYRLSAGVGYKLYTVLIAWHIFALTGMQTFADVTDPSTTISYFGFQTAVFPRDCHEIPRVCSNTHNTSGVYRIKPAGFPKSFEVYCDGDPGTGGWTVIQRRSSGSIDFNRNWEHYKQGFGFLGTEFWLGNEKIAYLTQQKKYQLRIDITDAKGQSYHVTFDNFRVGDEKNSYALMGDLGTERSTANSYIEWCPYDRSDARSTCQRNCSISNTCANSTTMEPEKCICPDSYSLTQPGEDCIPLNQCRCFLEDVGYALSERESYLNPSCTSRVTCTDNGLIHKEYRCSDQATCEVRSGVGSCVCNEGFAGDGQRCMRIVTTHRKDCYEYYMDGMRADGLYTIYPTGWEETGFQVYCDMTTGGGGWTVIQRRNSNLTDFYRGWNAYKKGFGNLSANHWLGNDKIHILTNQKVYQLKVNLVSGSRTVALYSTFSIGDERDNYTLSLGTYTGNSGYDAMNWNSGKSFSTRDRDNDGRDGIHCSQRHQGGWWYGYAGENPSCTSWHINGIYGHCSYSNLNGRYNEKNHQSIFWWRHPGNDCGVGGTSMEIRPLQ
ncbi:putative tenascin-R [Apostichopus japonicus]|uniref:Putative tenascin-R n=1 Tax=Stichopus japonicus TaxID=307972 RepID=A0A2G8JIH3_STIJA|nr:putative tenascin-R [Apostichopus japonicus]